MARGERAGVEAAAPSRGRRREEAQALGAAAGAGRERLRRRTSSRPVAPCAFVPSKPSRPRRARAAGVFAVGRARAKTEGGGGKTSARPVTGHDAPRGGAPRRASSRRRARALRASEWIEKAPGSSGGGSARRSERTGRDAPFRWRARHRAPARALVSCSPVAAWFTPPGRKASRAPLLARAARGVDPRTRAETQYLSCPKDGQNPRSAAAGPARHGQHRVAIWH